LILIFNKGYNLKIKIQIFILQYYYDFRILDEVYSINFLETLLADYNYLATV